MLLLLDTTILVDVLRVRLERKTLLAALVGQGHTFATTAINVAEVYAGLRPAEGDRVEVFFSSLEIYPLTAVIARRAGKLKGEWSKRGGTLQLPVRRSDGTRTWLGSHDR